MQGRFFRLNAHFNGKSELGEGRKDSREAFGGNYVSRSYFVLVYKARRRTRESSYGVKERKSVTRILEASEQNHQTARKTKGGVEHVQQHNKTNCEILFHLLEKKVWDQVLSSVVVIAFAGHVRIYCLIALFSTLFKSPLINQSGTHGLPF